MAAGSKLKPKFYSQQKKAQNLGGLIRVFVIGLFIFSIWPFITGSFDLAAATQTGLAKWIIEGIPFIMAYMLLHFAYTLGEGTEPEVLE